MSEIIDKIDKKDVAKILGGVIIGLFGGVLLKSKIKKILDKTGLLGKNAFAGVNAP